MDNYDDPRSISDIRSEARRLTNGNVSISFSFAGKFFLATATVLGIVGGGLASLGMFNLSCFIGLITISFFITCIAFISSEWSRLIKHSNKLKELLTAERSYEILLQQTREEKEEINKKLGELRAIHELTIASQGMMAKISTMSLTNIKDQTNENDQED